MLPLFALPILVIFFLFGLCLGSFGNVVIGRVPAGDTLNGRSRCPRCKRTLGLMEIVPVISWVLLRARCKGCKKPISAQYPIIELIAGGLFMIAFLTHISPLPSAALAMVLWAMLMITVIDLRTQMIPDSLTLALAIAAALHQVLLTGAIDVTGALLGTVFLGAQWVLSRGKWIGSGDVFLVCALGLFLGGWMNMTVALFGAYISGALVVTVLLATKKISRKAHVPFGPFLIFGSLVAFFYGEWILERML